MKDEKRYRLPTEEGEDPSMKLLFEHAARVGASDVLLTAHAPPSLRIHGELISVTGEDLAPEAVKKLIWSLINETQQEMLERRRELDFSLAVTGNLRFRANLYYQKGCVSGAFRLIPKKIPALAVLGLPPVVRELTLRMNGLVLVTGPTGSGKSTTMASMIDLINETRRAHVVTVEDPIEFVHENKRSIVDQREVYSDTLSFSNALKYVLRETPDVILIGEMRDIETTMAALTAAETGHLVIATLHTNDAVQAIDRVIDIFPPHQQEQVRTQLSFVLQGVIAHQLIPRADGEGRVLATEILLRSPAVANHIREGKTHMTRTIIEGSRRDGMQTMDSRIHELHAEGLISREEAARRVSPSYLEQLRRAPPPGRTPPPAPPEDDLRWLTG